ncbi:hypothetical protein SDC9_33257 [bioreactor metagenome]|uniref:Uncharacterized protein n=1 Tax=bioreactor metagenome TaxID=1076179 RepID=A0A644V7S4_9ZZZZ|nr:hypothetical protein [Candidatus Elulimicrobiales bacterium]
MKKESATSATKEGVKILKENGFIYLFLFIILLSLYGFGWLTPIIGFFGNILSRIFNGIFSINLNWKGILLLVGLFLLLNSKPKKEKKK